MSEPTNAELMEAADEHFPVGDGWICSCGHDFFGGSAAYGIALYRAHLTAVIEARA